MRANSPAAKVNVSDSEFENLLRRASESVKLRQPHSLKSVESKRSDHSDAGKNTLPNLDASHLI